MAKSIEGTISDLMGACDCELEVRLANEIYEKYKIWPKFQVPKEDGRTTSISYWHTHDTCWDMPLEEPKQLERLADEGWSDYTYRYFRTFNPQEEHKMYVYDVVVVNKDDASVVYDGIQVTETIEQAKMLTMAEIMRESAPTNDVVANYHFAIQKVGEGYSK